MPRLGRGTSAPYSLLIFALMAFTAVSVYRAAEDLVGNEYGAVAIAFLMFTVAYNELRSRCQHCDRTLGPDGASYYANGLDFCHRLCADEYAKKWRAPDSST